MRNKNKADLHLRHSAFHESGHAAAAIYLNCFVREVYVYDERRKYHGNARFEISQSETREQADLKAMIVGLSGIPAALKHAPDRDPRGVEDRRLVSTILQRFPTAKRLPLRKNCEVEASRLVDLLWPKICEIAVALQNQQPDVNGKRVLSEEEVLQVYSAADVSVLDS
jgi:hypothetical protein